MEGSGKAERQVKADKHRRKTYLLLLLLLPLLNRRNTSRKHIFHCIFVFFILLFILILDKEAKNTYHQPPLVAQNRTNEGEFIQRQEKHIESGHIPTQATQVPSSSHHYSY
jgi:hypothetical protein